jgi:hypothetical protein
MLGHLMITLIEYHLIWMAVVERVLLRKWNTHHPHMIVGCIIVRLVSSCGAGSPIVSSEIPSCGSNIILLLMLGHIVVAFLG